MINLVVLFSSFENETQINNRLENEISYLINSNVVQSKIGLINSVDKFCDFATHINENFATIVIIASGGTEEYAKLLVESNKNPILILANSKSNSLAASLEILAYFRDNKKLKHAYYENMSEFEFIINNFALVNESIYKINNSKIGMIGNPSNWLLTSQNVTSLGNFKAELIEIDVEEINAKVEDIQTVETPTKIENDYKTKCIPTSDIKQSSKVYDAIKGISEIHKLDALTVRCFDLLKHNYTACMALSILNDENIVSGCEGDIFALFTMLVANKLTNKPVWMANPASINKKDNTLILAHCTIPSKMLNSLDESQLTTHMESGLSVAIQGPLKKQEVTLMRIGGNFNKILFTSGNIVETDMRDSQLCRTQVRIKIDVNIQEWMNNSLGNHQILVYGNITNLLTDFCNFTDIEIINCSKH